MTAAELREAGAFEGFDNNFERGELAVVDAVDLLAKPYTPPRMRVQSLVPCVGLVLLTGDTGALKTAFMLHMAACLASGIPVAARFVVERDPRPQIYLNGEMGSALLRRYLHQAAAGLGVEVERGSILFEGSPDGVAGFHYGNESREQLEALLERYTPSVVYFDTQRALFGIDENDTGAVRNVCRWLAHLCEKFQLVIILSHHLRKLGPVSNSSHERVAGSRDWINAADCHLEARSREGGPMHTLAIGKTRTPSAEASAGTEWPIKARLDLDVEPSRSIIVAEEPSRGPAVQQVADVAGELRARLEAEGPLTLAEMNAKKGNGKRAYEQLRDAGAIIQVSKEGRSGSSDLPACTMPRTYSTRTRSALTALVTAFARNPTATRDRTRSRPGRGPNAMARPGL